MKILKIKNKKEIIISIAIGIGILGTAFGCKTYMKAEEEKSIEKAEQTKAENAKSTDSLIEKVGDVTLTSEKDIIKAEKSYNALSKEEKALVTKYDVLEKARTTYDGLVSEKKTAEGIEKEINALGDITLEKEDIINDLYTRYSALSETAKGYVKSYDTLKNAMDTIVALKEDINKKENDEVAEEKKSEDTESTAKTTKKAESKAADTENENSVTDTNGNSVTIDSDTASKTVDEGNGNTTTTYTNGGKEQTWVDPDGTITIMYADGSAKITSPDGTYAVFSPEGVIVDKNYEFDENAHLEFGN